MKKKIIVAICGASGVIYGIRLLKALLERPTEISLVISKAGQQVLKHETDFAGGAFEDYLAEKGVKKNSEAKLMEYENDNFFAPFASGSFVYDAMVVAPCTMGTLGAVASGLANNLIHRAADVCLKEKRPLILLPRETPFSTIHIENMLKVSKAGATIMPPSPSFYSHPETIEAAVDSVVARVLDHIGVGNDLVKRWGVSS